MAVNINRANVFELEQAFHSRERAQEVLNRRELRGDFRDWNDLRERLRGITEGMISDLERAGVTSRPNGALDRSRRSVPAAWKGPGAGRRRPTARGGSERRTPRT